MPSLQFTKSLSSLAVEYVDLFLLHYPACWPELCGAGVVPAGRWQDSWKALETLVDKGLIRAIGRVAPPNLQLTGRSQMSYPNPFTGRSVLTAVCMTSMGCSQILNLAVK